MRLVDFLFPFWRAAWEGRWMLLRTVLVIALIVWLPYALEHWKDLRP